MSNTVRWIFFSLAASTFSMGCDQVITDFVNVKNSTIVSRIAPEPGLSLSEVNSQITLKKIFPSTNSYSSVQGSSLQVVVQAMNWNSAFTTAGFKLFLGGVEATLVSGKSDVFQASVPASAALNTIAIELCKDQDSLTLGSLTLNSPAASVPLTGNPFDIVMSPDQTKGYILGHSKDIIEVNLLTGARRVVYTNSFSQMFERGVISPDGTKLYIGGNTFSLFQLDLNTGVMTTISSDGVRGAGFPIYWTNGLAINSAGTKVYFVELFDGFVTEVDIATGDRTIITSDGGWAGSVGSGPALGIGLNGAVLNPANTVLYTVDNGSLVAVTIANGARTIVSSLSLNIGTGPDLGSGEASYTNAAGTKLYVMGNGVGRNLIIEVDLATGNRTVISGLSRGTGPVGNCPYGMAHSALRDTSYIIDMCYDEVIKVDSMTGDRSMLYESSINSGVSIPAAIRSFVSTDGSSIYMATATGIYAVDPSTGQRSAISDTVNGSGIKFVNIVDFSYNRGSDYFYVLDGGSNYYLPNYSIFKVHRITGQRTIVSTAGVSGIAAVGSGPAFGIYSYTFAVNTQETFAYVNISFGTPGILLVDLNSGNRSMLSGTGIGSGTDFTSPYSLSLSLNQSILYVVDTSQHAIYSVDVATGNRSIVASNTLGTGISLNSVGSLQTRTATKLSFYSSPNFYELDLTTGNRTVLYNFSTGYGSALPWNAKYDSVDAFGRIFMPSENGLLQINTLTSDRVLISK